MGRKINGIVKILEPLHWVVYVLQVGSSLREENPKDIDLLIGTVHSEKGIPYDELQTSLELSGIRSIERSDDALRFTFEENVFDVALYTHEHVYAIVTGVMTGTLLEGRLAHWATRAWLPEGFCADLKHGKVLLDKSGILKSLIKSLQVYPLVFKERILKRCALEIESKLIELRRVDNGSIDSILIRADISAALIRYAFAYDEVFLRSYKKLNERAAVLGNSARKIFSLAEQIQNADIYSIEQKIKKQKIIS